MRIGLLSDAHGNALGTEICLKYLSSQGLDAVYFLGDAVGYLPQEGDVLKLLTQFRVLCQKGNHDAMLIGELPEIPDSERIYQHIPAQHRLTANDRRQLTAWPIRRELTIDRRSCLLVHGSPWNPLEERIYSDSDWSRFDGLPYTAIFMGHTHRPFVIYRGETVIVNVGSCGLPRDDGRWLSCAIYDGRTHKAEIIRLPSQMDELMMHLRTTSVASEVMSIFTERRSNSIVGRRIGEDA